ncbi:MAG: lipopolysaccharide biosynthesis protein [Hellea sp.]|nr:lipopolysaccharide biosynthesis protein [Hellea sp.]
MTPNFDIQSQKSAGKRIASNAGLLIGAKIIGTIFGLGTLKIASDVLDPVAFGTVIFLHAYMLFFGEVTTFKNWQSVIRFGTDDSEAKDPHAFGRLVKFTAKLDFVSVLFAYGLSVALIGFAVFLFKANPGLAPNDLDVDVLQKFVPLYCLVLIFRQVGTSEGVLRLFDRFGLLAIEALVLPVLRFAGSVYVLLTGGGFEAFLIVWFIASAAGYSSVIMFALLELRKRHLFDHVKDADQGFKRTREGLWAFAIKSNLDSSIASGFLHLPLIMVTAAFGPAWAGVYKIAEEVMKLLTEGFKLLEQVIYPELAKFVSQGQPDKIWPVVKRASIWMLSFGFFASAIIWFAGPDVLTYLFGETFRPSAYLAALLVPGAALLGCVTPIYPIFYAANKPERAIYVRGGALIVYVISFAVLGFLIGKMAPGWAIIVCNSFAVILALLVARSTLRSMIREKHA